MINYNKYLNVTTLEKDWGFYVNTVGSAKIAPYKSYPNNRVHPKDHSFTWNKGRILDGYYIVFITRGEGILESALTRPYQVKAGTCFILFPGVWHRYRPVESCGWEEYWVGFNGQYPKMLMEKGLLNPGNPFIETGMNTELLGLFHELIHTTQTAEVGYRQIITGMILKMLGLIHTIAKYKSLSANQEPKLISKAKFLLQESIDASVNLEDVAKELPMGYSRFRKTFKAYTGTSPNQYLLNLRLDKAKELLVSTNLTVGEIAYQTGFESIFYFSRLFKQKNGNAPKFYRENAGTIDQPWAAAK